MNTQKTITAQDLTITLEKAVFSATGINVKPIEDYVGFKIDLHGYELGELIPEEGFEEINYIPKQNISLCEFELEVLLEAIETIKAFMHKDHTMEILETIEELEDYREHEELLNVYDRYAASELKRHLDMFDVRGHEFIAAFVVEGKLYSHLSKRDKGLMLLYRSAEGLLFLKRVQAGTMISAAPMRQVYLYEHGIKITDNKIEKTPENRRAYSYTNVILH